MARGEVLAEVDRLTPMVTRARELVEDLDRRAQQHEAATTAGDQAAVEALVESITGGRAATPVTPDLDITAVATNRG